MVSAFLKPKLQFPQAVVVSLMTFLFKLNGHLALTEIRSISRSYVSLSCIRRLGLIWSGEVIEGAVSVNIGNSWAMCIVSLLSSPSECGDLDMVLGRDWYGHLKELCTATETTFPMELVSRLCCVCMADLVIRSATFYASWACTLSS